MERQLKPFSRQHFNTHREHCSVFQRSHGMPSQHCHRVSELILDWERDANSPPPKENKDPPAFTPLTKEHLHFAILRPPLKLPLNFTFSVALTSSQSTKLIVPKIPHCFPVPSPKSHCLPLTLPAVVSCLLSSWLTLKYSDYPANTQFLKESELSLLVYVIRNRSIFLRNPDALDTENPVLFYIASLNFDLRKHFRKKIHILKHFLQLKITSVLTSNLISWCKSELITLK